MESWMVVERKANDVFSEHWSDPCAEHCGAARRCESHLLKSDFSFCPISANNNLLIRSVLVPSASTKSSTTAFMWTTYPMPIYQGLFLLLTLLKNMTILSLKAFPSNDGLYSTSRWDRWHRLCQLLHGPLQVINWSLKEIWFKAITISIPAARSATVVIAYLMMKQNMTCKQVPILIKEYIKENWKLSPSNCVTP